MRNCSIIYLLVSTLGVGCLCGDGDMSNMADACQRLSIIRGNFKIKAMFEL